MKLAQARAGILSIVTSLLLSCGGGGGNDGDGGNPSPSGNTSFSLSRTAIDVSRTAGELAPVEDIVLTISSPPQTGLYVAATVSGNGVEALDFVASSPTRAKISVRFKPPGTLQNGTYEDTVKVYVCYEDDCARPVRNSPQSILMAYHVTGEGTSTATIDRSHLEVVGDVRNSSPHDESIDIVLDKHPPAGLFKQYTNTTNAIRSVSVGTHPEGTGIGIGYLSPFENGLGTHDDQVTVRLCYDEACTREIKGSPFVITSRFTVTIGVEPGVPPLPIERREALGHDIVAAAFSKALNAIVTVGASPDNAIYVYDVANGVESSQPLARAPTGLALSPDGQTAGVGHEFNVSIVDLAMVGIGGAPAPTLLDFDEVVEDLVLDGAGRVHAVPPPAWADRIHTLDITTNTEAHSDWVNIYDLKLHPSRTHLYAIKSNPIVMSRWDVSSGQAVKLGDWPYAEPERNGCYRLWLDEPGTTIFTRCGETFHASADPGIDMTYAGVMTLTEPVGWLFNSIHSLSIDEARAEVAIVEADELSCDADDIDLCFSRVAYFDKATLERTAIYGIGPITHDGRQYAQVGRHLFHDAASGKKYLIGEMQDPPGPELRYWLTVIP